MEHGPKRQRKQKNIRNKKGTITMKENYTEAVEVCPHCECENVYQNWDVSKQGYVVICQGCGKEIMLCDECLHADDNPGQKCNWSKEKGCFRHPKEDDAHKFHALVITKDHIENIMSEVERRIDAICRDCQGNISEEEVRDMRAYIQTGVYATLMAISSNWPETVGILDEEETKRNFWNI